MQVEVELLGLWFERFGALYLVLEVLEFIHVWDNLIHCCVLEKLGLYAV